MASSKDSPYESRREVAFTFVKVELNLKDEVGEQLKKIPEVTEVFSITDEYDFIMKIETSNFVKLGRVVADKVRAIKGITDTKTLPRVVLR